MRSFTVNKWTDYISYKTKEVNLERVSSIEKITGNEVREYVFRTLDILAKYRDSLTAYEYALIATHGLLGQAIRGEVNVSDSAELAKILKYMPAEKAGKLILILNECIVRAISDALWDKIKYYTAAKHIMFQPLMNTLYYDYMGKKTLNIYKFRVIQHCLKNGNETEHCRLSCVEQKYTPRKWTVERHNFKGPLDHRYTQVREPDTGLYSVTGDINFMREFLYTFT